MFKSNPKYQTTKHAREQGQALVEYALIAVLIGIAFGLAMAASAPITGNLFNAVVRDLMGQTAISHAPNSTGFWETVTKVYEFVPEGGSIPTNTPAASTMEATEGPSPTPTVTRTPTEPIPTRTPTLTATAPDFYKNAPFVDSADEADWWRLDNNVILSGIPWIGRFWDNVTLDGPHDVEVRGIWRLHHSHFPPEMPAENFSARFERRVQLNGETTLNFSLRADDGVRMFIETEDRVSTPVVLRRSDGGTNSWRGQSPTDYTGSAVLPEGISYIIVEYYQATGGYHLEVDITGAGATPDDSAVDNTGNPVSDNFSCRWNRSTDERNANTERRLFDDYGETHQQNPTGSLCYLEWRGAVTIPAGSNMQLHFWDVWEFDHSGVDGWLEVAEYIPDPDESSLTADRENMVWTKVDLNRAGTANFNWTHNVIDLQPLMSGWQSNRLAFRFAMQIPAGVTANRQWFIDDVAFKEKVENVFPVDKLWKFDNTIEREDFITTGGTSNPGEQSGWGLVTNNRIGSTGFAFHDSVDAAYDSPTNIAGLSSSPYTTYENLTISPDSTAINDVRLNTLEINGWVDLTQAPSPDSLGNTGDRVLAFHHAYDLKTLTGLVVQYSTTPKGIGDGTGWTTLPDGEIRSVTATGDARSLTFQEHVINLEDLPGDPQRIRIRFAMLVHRNAGLGDGWWIDNIRLGRLESEKWTDYPFFDDAQGQGPFYNWTFNGQWGLGNDRGRPVANAPEGYQPLSYASSPNANYENGSSTYMTLRWPIDLYNDTPDRVVQYVPGGATGTTNSHGGPAVDPYLTFDVWRELANGEKFVVQWKHVSETDSQYKTLWYQSTTGSTLRNTNRTWEPVRISLRPILETLTGAPGTGNLTDDDINLRIGLIANNNNNAAGLWIDNIRLAENTLEPFVFKLWPVGVSRGSFGTGNGTLFISDADGTIDGRPYQDDWRMGGIWSAQNFEQRIGNFAFHDSVTGGQDRAPTGIRRHPSGSSDYGDSAWTTPTNSFSILELNRVIDLRGTDAATEGPRLNFWTRYHIGNSDLLRIEVSQKLTGSDTAIRNTMRSRCDNTVYQCFDLEYGWSAWSRTYADGSPIWELESAADHTRNYGWHRISVDLSPFAQSQSPSRAGQQIRIRFVYSSLSNNTNRDGWYIDNVELAHRPISTVYNIHSTDYVDEGNIINNWITEGRWGMDPSLSIQGTNANNSLGLWTGRWWASTGRIEDFLDRPNRGTPAYTITYSYINLNFGSGSPVAGWNRTDQIAAEFTLNLVVDGVNFVAGPRQFITLSDDGVRLKVERLDAGGNPIANPIQWNVLSNWGGHSATIDKGTYDFIDGQRYRITLQYFESGGDGVIQLGVLSSMYLSYSDSPRITDMAPDVPPIPYASTSLVGRQVFDLRNFNNTNYPLMEIVSKYRLDGNTYARVEVSSNGGFSWGTNGLSTSIGGITMSPSSWNNTVSTGLDNPDTGQWNTRIFNLSSFEGQQIQIRFRFDTTSTYCMRRDNCNDSNAVNNPSLALRSAYYNGWWIGRIRISRFNN